jgi:hypothetical protein
MRIAIRGARIVRAIEQGMVIRSIKEMTDGSGESEPSVLDVRGGVVHAKQVNR